MPHLRVAGIQVSEAGVGPVEALPRHPIKDLAEVPEVDANVAPSLKTVRCTCSSPLREDQRHALAKPHHGVGFPDYLQRAITQHTNTSQKQHPKNNTQTADPESRLFSMMNRSRVAAAAAIGSGGCGRGATNVDGMRGRRPG